MLSKDEGRSLKSFFNGLKELVSSVVSKAKNNAGNGAVGSEWESVSTLWGKRAAELIDIEKPTAWTDSPLVQQMYIHPLISGRADVAWLETVSKKDFPAPVQVALSLGCGGGGLERHGAALNIAKQFIAYDVSEGAIQLARNIADDNGLSQIIYKAADLNTMIHPENAYDVVFASQSLHHIESLEHYLDQVRRALKPNGLFIINEFVGPNQFQWTEVQMRHSQNLLEAIPECYRQIIQGHGLKSSITRPTIEFMNGIDPTEAIRSADIIPEINKRFDVLEKTDFGGTLLQLVLGDIVGNFSDTLEDRRVLQSIFDEEKRLIGNGELESDFTLMIMRNNK